MTTLWLTGIALVIAAIDWAALWSNKPAIESVARPAVMIALIAAAAASTDSPDAVRWFVIAGLGFGLVGDVLLLPKLDRFVLGLGSFLVGHVLYIVGFVSYGTETAPGVVGVFIAVALSAVMGPPILRGLAGSRLAMPVGLYVATITVMVAVAIATGSWWFGIGAFVFALSDALLGHDRFVTPRIDRRIWVHVLYHLGQAAIVAGLST